MSLRQPLFVLLILILHKQTKCHCLLSAAASNGPTDDHCVINLMQGLCFKSVGRLEEATQCFEKVIERYSKWLTKKKKLSSVFFSAAGLQYDHYAPPAACWQLGMLLMKEGKYNLASKKLETAKYAI